MRLMILKHIRNWSYVTLEREVRANLVYRNFTRVGAGKMPDRCGRLVPNAHGTQRFYRVVLISIGFSFPTA
jgi:hypothetical protein